MTKPEVEPHALMQTILTFIRHFLAASGAVLTTQGFTLDTTSTSTLIFGLVMLAASVLWSWFSKLQWALGVNDPRLVTDERREVIRKLLAAIASQLVAAFSGWLWASGFAGDVNDPAAVLLFVGNLSASRLRGVPPVKVLVFALSSLPFALCSCSSTSQEALKSRLEVALKSAGREVSAVALAATLQTLRSELALLEAKPVDDDWSQQLVDQNRLVAIKAAIRLSEERMRTLNAQHRTLNLEAKQPVNVQPLGSVHQPSTDNHQQPSLPLYAPQVVAALRQ
jgi:hypothetical protein